MKWNGTPSFCRLSSWGPKKVPGLLKKFLHCKKAYYFIVMSKPCECDEYSLCLLHFIYQILPTVGLSDCLNVFDVSVALCLSVTCSLQLFMCFFLCMHGQHRALSPNLLCPPPTPVALTPVFLSASPLLFLCLSLCGGSCCVLSGLPPVSLRCPRQVGGLA